MTTPPTNAAIDSYVASNLGAALQGLYPSSPAYLGAAYVGGAGQYDSVIWVVAYTDNAATAHYDFLGIFPSGVAGASDAELESTSPVATGSGSEFTISSGLGIPANFPSQLATLYALKQAYGSINLRGYLVPAISSFSAVDSTVQTWVNDSSNWGTAG